MTYLDWLAMIAFPDGELRSHYNRILIRLYDTDFYWVIDQDRNRATDGEHLRFIFEEETGLECDKNGECSVLEMMIALAIRCEAQIMHDPEEGDRTHFWFWEMFNNLGLSAYTDDCIDDYSWHDYSETMDIFMGRRYCKDGKWGPFYIENFDGDMRKIELWYQLNYYLQENFL